MRNLILILVAALSLAATGCFQGMAEDQVRKTLTRALGPAEKYDVKISNTSDGMLLNGEVKDLTIDAKRVRTKDGLVIQRFDVRMLGLKLSKDKKKIDSVESATFDLDITQEDLSTLARSKVRQIGDVQVLLAPGEVALMAPARALGQTLDVSLRGSLNVEQGQRISFIPSTFSLGPLKVDDVLLQNLLHRVNPVADLSRLPVPVHIDLLAARQGVLNVKGTLFAKP